jgi:hypothetical protein
MQSSEQLSQNNLIIPTRNLNFLTERKIIQEAISDVKYVDYNRVKIGSSKICVVEYKNNFAQKVKLYGAFICGGMFTSDSIFPKILDSGQTVQLRVTFEPRITGEVQDRFLLFDVSNISYSDEKDIFMNGTIVMLKALKGLGMPS